MIRTMIGSIFVTGMIFALGTLSLAQPDATATIGALKDYQPQMGRTKLLAVEDLIRKSHGDSALRSQIEQQMIALLESDATPEAKQFVCRHLWVIGTAAFVPTLQKMLVDETTTQMACYALKSNPAPEVNKALRESAPKVKGTAQQAIVNLLGDRHDAEALAVLQPLVSSSDVAIAESALVAIGKIGTMESAAFLAEKRKTVAEPLQMVATRAYLQCARELAAKGTTDAAVKIYEELKSDAEPHLIRRGAIVGIMELGGPRAQRLVFDLLLKGDPQLKAAALAGSRNIKGGEFTRQMIMFMQSLPPADQTLALEALIDRNERAVLPLLNRFAEHSNLQVRLTAIKGLGQQGDEACVPALVAAMAGEEAVKQAATLALRKLSGDKPNDAMIRAVPDSAPAVRGELIRILTDRKVTAAVPMLLTQAAGTDESAAKLSLKALSDLAGPKELPQILDIVCSNSPESIRSEAELTAKALDNKVEAVIERSQLVLDRLSKVKDTPCRCALLRILGGNGDPASLSVLEQALSDPDGEIRGTALRTLAGWPNDLAVRILLNTAEQTRDSTTKTLALRGAIRGIETDKEYINGLADYSMGVAQRINHYQWALELSADRPEEKKMILAGLSAMEDPRAMAMAVAQLSDTAVVLEAAQAAVRIAAIQPPGDKVTEAMNKVIQASDSAELRQKAEQILQRKMGLNFESACWIWAPDSQGDPLQQVPAGKLGFRRPFWLGDKKIRQAQILISADDQYILYVNGQKVGQGQPWMQGGRYDLTDRLKSRENILAVEVTNSGPSPAGLIANLEITDDAGNKTYIVSDSRWKCSTSLPDGWTQPDFTDAPWSWAKVYGLYGCPPWEKKIIVP